MTQKSGNGQKDLLVNNFVNPNKNTSKKFLEDADADAEDDNDEDYEDVDDDEEDEDEEEEEEEDEEEEEIPEKGIIETNM